MLNLTRHEKLVLIFLAASALIGSVMLGYKNMTDIVALEVTPHEEAEPDIRKLVRMSKIVNINSVGENELTRLSGIGPVLALRIVEYRRVNGPFECIEEIKEVKGIGPKKFDDMKEFIKIE